MIEFILGGARSGKSRYAEKLAIDSAKKVIYIATAEAGDSEMQVRINRHRQQRPQHWITIEEPIKLAEVINQHNGEDYCLLVDCLTLWLSNIMFDKQGQVDQQVFETQLDALLECLQLVSGQIILVSNELGLGVVAMEKMTRRFVDESGLLHQQIAQLSDKVVFVTAGLPHVLK